MRTIMAPFLWLGRVLLWIVFFPIGIWRSLSAPPQEGRAEHGEANGKDAGRARAEALTVIAPSGSSAIPTASEARLHTGD
jgi:hypothetical protein